MLYLAILPAGYCPHIALHLILLKVFSKVDSNIIH